MLLFTRKVPNEENISSASGGGATRLETGISPFQVASFSLPLRDLCASV
jgi:hypothetical protein